VKDVVELHALDMSWSPRVFAMELCCKFWYRDFRDKLLGIVFIAVFFSLNEILESSLVPATVEYLLYFPFHFSVDDYRQWVVFYFSFCDRVI